MATPVEKWINKGNPKGAAGNVADPKVGDQFPELDTLEGFSPEELAWVKKDPSSFPRSAPGFVKDTAAWDKATKIVKQSWDNYDSPWAVVVSLSKSIQG